MCLAEMGFVNMIKVNYRFCLQVKGFKLVSTPAFISVHTQTSVKLGRGNMGHIKVSG